MSITMARRRRVLVLPSGFAPQGLSSASGESVLALHKLRDGTGDGSALLGTPVDPLLLALPVLEASSAKLVPGSQLVDSVGATWGPAKAWSRLLRGCLSQGLLGRVCDVDERMGPSMLLYRLSLPKTRAWLRRKLGAAVAAIASEREARILTDEALLRARLQNGEGGAFQVSSGSSAAAAATAGATPTSAPASSCQVAGAGPARPSGRADAAAAATTTAAVGLPAVPAAGSLCPASAIKAASRQDLVEAARLLASYLSDALVQELCACVADDASGVEALDWEFVTGRRAQSRSSAAAAAAKASRASRPRPGYSAAGSGGVADVARFISTGRTAESGSSPASSEAARAAKRRLSGDGRVAKKLKGVDTSGMRSLASMFGPRRKA
ncbi:hypothetical protein FNF31_06788 [Cafeteria roenbergensis]|uniref:Uncharacterized protein n=1 Tax=Cafeteria roenbergensis TaxID=33653 RepID=A0A5A8CIV8_CAFRO|nr:hypothetical protein FNF31_06788 [Cafeteria roenbergensis]